MSPILHIAQSGQSLQNVWDRINRKSEELAAQVANGELSDNSFVQTAVELKTLQLQADAAGLVFQTLNDMAEELLNRPRK